MQLLKEAKSKGIQIYLDGEKLKVKAEAGALTDDLRSRIKQLKPALITLLLELNQVKKSDNGEQIKALGQIKGVLSYPQQRLWLAEQLSPDSTQFVIPAALRFSGVLNTVALQESFNAIIERHEILRTTYVEGKNIDGEYEPVQVINEAHQVIMGNNDLSNLTEYEQEQVLKRLQQKEEGKPFGCQHTGRMRLGGRNQRQGKSWLDQGTRKLHCIRKRRLLACRKSEGAFRLRH